MLAGILCIAGASIMKAVADTLEHHYDTSIFKKWNSKWWNPAESYLVVKFLPWTKYRPDPWHLANSCMMVLVVLYGFFYEPVFSKWYLELAMYGGLWILPFNLCYNTLFKIKSASP